MCWVSSVGDVHVRKPYLLLLGAALYWYNRGVKRWLFVRLHVVACAMSVLVAWLAKSRLEPWNIILYL